jgi:putative Holliday junction resolvase
MRMASLDVGKKYIGIAITDETGAIATPFQTYKRQTLKLDLQFFDYFIKKYKIKKLIIGYPLNFDDTENEMSRFVKKFYHKLKDRWGIPVILFDERYTTDEAENIIKQFNKKKLISKKELKDKIAAAVILKSYIETNRIEQ